MDSINELIAFLKQFPGIGKKSARRIALYLLKQDEEYLSTLGQVISGFKKDLQTCGQCGNISHENPCSICADPMRDRKTLCVVEDIEVLSAFEEAGVYNGLYHVLGRISPLGGQDFDDEAIKFLLKHIKALKADEVIVALSPKIENDMTYYELLNILKKSKVKTVSRLAFGLPVGGAIEFADKMTLHTAIESRRPID